MKCSERTEGGWTFGENERLMRSCRPAAREDDRCTAEHDVYLHTALHISPGAFSHLTQPRSTHELVPRRVPDNLNLNSRSQDGKAEVGVPKLRGLKVQGGGRPASLAR